MLGLFSTTVAAQIQCINPVDAHGDRKQIIQGDFGATIRWKQVAISKNTIGYGSAAERSYELTIEQGRVYMVRPTESGNFEVRSPPWT